MMNDDVALDAKRKLGHLQLIALILASVLAACSSAQSPTAPEQKASPVQSEDKRPNHIDPGVSPAQRWIHHIQDRAVFRVTTYGSNIWLISQNGLSQLDLNQDQVIDYPNQNWHNNPLSLAVDNFGQLWVGFVYGTPFGSGDYVWLAVAKFDGQPWHKDMSPGFTLYGSYRFPSKPPKITVDTQNNLWVLSPYNRLVKYDGTDWYDQGQLELADVNVMYSDPQGRLWFGNNDGAFVLDGEQVSRFVSGNITAIAVSEDDQRWFGTAENGIIHTSGRSIRTYTVADGLHGNKILDLGLDSRGDLWVAYQDQAIISQFTGTKLIHYRAPTTLASETIFQMAVDGNDRIWLASDKGLGEFEPRP